MSIERIACTSRQQLADTLAQRAARAVAEYGCVDVVLAQASQADAVKLGLMAAVPVGARVLALPHWIEEQWALWGSGSSLVGDSQRHVLLRPLLRQLAGLEPSSAYVEAFSSFVQDALAAGGAPAEEGLARALAEYRLILEQRGLTEAALTHSTLAQAAAGRAVIFVTPAEEHPRVRLLVERVGQTAQVVVLERELPCTATAREGASEHDSELAQLRQLLYSGQGGLVPSGACAAAEVVGIHAEAAAVLQLLRRWLDAGACPGEIALAFPQAAQAYPLVVQELADAGIPVECRYSLPLGQTAFGAAFMQLEKILADEDDGFANSAAFLCSPYSGMSAQDARGFAAAWRGQAGSTHSSRREDMTAGLRGRSGAKLWDAKLGRLRALLAEPSPAGRARLMLDNARAFDPGQERLEDDAAALAVLCDHLELCEQLGAPSCPADIAALCVPLVCAAGEGPALRICSASQLGSMAGVRYILLARLDKDRYPMACAPQPFDSYLQQMGAPVLARTALCNRTILLDALEAAAGGFACYRLATDEEGSPSCQSALWDELMTAYRRPGEEEAPPQELAAALVQAGCGLSVCEDELFAQARQVGSPVLGVQRGQLGIEALDLVFPDEGSSETFSPTALEDYYRCPYRWFACRRVGANSPDKPFDQIAKGNLAHAVLERFYLLMAEEGIPRVTPDNLEVCLQLADEAFSYQRQHEIERHRLNLMSQRDVEESELVRRQVRELVERDAFFLPGFKPTYLELKLEDPDGAPLRYAGVPVRGKVDRIDVDEQGRAVVIDYKLSGLGAGYGLSAEGALPTRIQTDIYATLVQRCLEQQDVQVQVVGSVYRSYAKNRLRGVYAEGLDWGPAEDVRPDKDAVPGGCLLQSYPEYLQAVEDEVAALMVKMRAGDIAPRPLCKDACEYCLAEPFCPLKRS